MSEQKRTEFGLTASRSDQSFRDASSRNPPPKASQGQRPEYGAPRGITIDAKADAGRSPVKLTLAVSFDDETFRRASLKPPVNVRGLKDMIANTDMSKTSFKASDLSRVRDKDNAQMVPPPPKASQFGHPRLAPPGMSGIRVSTQPARDMPPPERKTFVPIVRPDKGRDIER